MADFNHNNFSSLGKLVFVIWRLIK